jgi:hypothetical protein
MEWTAEEVATIACQSVTGYRVNREGSVITVEKHNGQVFRITVEEVTQNDD